MRDALIAILLCGVAVAACEANQSERAAARDNAELAIETAGDFSADDDRAGVQFRADTESGDIQVRLPGGIEGKFKLPEGIDAGNEFKLNGIGRYPGARLTGVDVKALDGDPNSDATVRMAFTAPGSADTVADWYEKAFVEKGRTVLRTGTTLSTNTSEGKPMVMALRDGTGGVAVGSLTIRDEKN
jgi:hypothetical protein